MSKRVQVVVGEFELLKRHKLAAPVRPGGGRVRVDVEPPGHGGLGLSSYRPIWAKYAAHQKTARRADTPRVRLSGCNRDAAGLGRLGRHEACVTL